MWNEWLKLKQFSAMLSSMITQEFFEGDKITAWYDDRMVVGMVIIVHRSLANITYRICVENGTPNGLNIELDQIDCSLWPITLVELDNILDGMMYE